LEETDITYISGSLVLILVIIIIKHEALKQVESRLQKCIGSFLEHVLVWLQGHCDIWEEEVVMFTASFATAKI